MRTEIENLVQKWYGASEQRYSDGQLLEMIYNRVGENSRVLDVGAGTGEKFSYDLKGRVAEMAGADLDSRVETNSLLDRGLCGDITAIPVENGYFDLVFCRYVLEHIAKPEQFLREMHRVLKRGGHFVFLTPNKWHYVSVFARLTPHWFHGWYNARLRGRDEKDTFPTLYRLNTKRALRRYLGAAGFVEETLIQRETCPGYLLWSKPAFYIGLAYERFVNSTPMLSGLRVHLLGSFVKE